MIIRFKYGFKMGDFVFGWKDRHPYRLPQEVNKKFYPILKVGKYNDLFYINRKLKSVRQLMAITTAINVEITVIEDDDISF